MRLRLSLLTPTLIAVAITASALLSGDFAYSINPDSNTVTITRYVGAGGAAVIPPSIEGMFVIAIGDNAFQDNGLLTSMEIPSSVTSIGTSSFWGCDGLTYLTIPRSVTYIGEWAFRSCSRLTSITIPDGIITISWGAFYSCLDLSSVSIPESVTTIENSVFAECHDLASITIPAGVSSLGTYVFYNCRNLVSVYFKGDAPSVGSNAFGYAYDATIYYATEATGWSATFGNRPTVLWNPLIQTDDGGFGVKANGFGFNITESSSGLVVVKGCANLGIGIWKPLQTNTMSGGTVNFADPNWTNHSSRLYRLVMPQPD